MKRVLLSLCLSVTLIGVFAQSKKVLSPDQWDEWKSVNSARISNDAKWIVYGEKPYRGDSRLFIYNTKDGKNTIIDRGYSHKIGYNNNFVVFKIKPQYDTLRTKRLAKVSKKKLPKDSIGIVVLSTGEMTKFPKVKSYSIGRKGGDWISYQLLEKIEKKEEEKKEVKDSVKKKAKKPKKKIKDKDAPKSYPLFVFKPVGGDTKEFDNVTEYKWSENGAKLAFVQQQNDTVLVSTLKVFDANSGETNEVFKRNGLVKKITVDKSGDQIAFMFSGDTVKEKIYSLWISGKKGVKMVSDVNNDLFPKNWSVSLKGKLHFSENGKRLFFGIAKSPVKAPKDTLLSNEKVKLDLWSWTDDRLQPQQLVNLSRDKNKTYRTVYNIAKGKITRLETKKVPNVYVTQKGNAVYALGSDNSKYRRQLSWDIEGLSDIYLFNIEKGTRKLYKSASKDYVRVSPAGKYLYWYSDADSSWYIESIKKGKAINVTKSLNVKFYDVEHDYPSSPGSYGFCGWTKDDKAFLVNDRYDIWRIDPNGKAKAVNITKAEGRKNSITFRHERLDYEQEYIDPTDKFYLSAFNNDNKESGFYFGDITGVKVPEKVVMGKYSFYSVDKAKNSDNLMWRRMSFTQYPDIYFGDMKFNGKKISDINPQQKDYNWGTSELYKWKTFDGVEAEGLLIKPENFDPNKKYPVVVYFYRLSSNGLYSYSSPRPSRSVINKSYYASNGYIVFVPNIRFKIGYPGESAYNYIVSGAMSLKNLPYVDFDHMGIQGQSWGGYQVTYLVTRTNLFKAAEAGAPVTNMTSAYGGIRWGSGMSRMFQYEQTQSRIGGTLWDRPFNYINNSALFKAPQINTPLMIMHNDNDGAVPWYQGIELFVALRRLNKPVWMLNYNGEPHNLRANSPNSRDLSIRMMQFFDHYLKEKPAPRWMINGIPAVDKGKDFGYDLVEDKVD
jgi:dipeptidyl aminopeptidase/acylaminoacyl peptidase